MAKRDKKERKVVKLKSNAPISDRVNGRLLSRLNLLPSSSRSSIIMKVSSYLHVIPVSRLGQLPGRPFITSMGDLIPVTEIKFGETRKNVFA